MNIIPLESLSKILFWQLINTIDRKHTCEADPQVKGLQMTLTIPSKHTHTHTHIKSNSWFIACHSYWYRVQSNWHYSPMSLIV